MSLPLFFLHPQTHIPPSVSMPRCRRRSYIPHMLPIPLVPVMEHRPSPPSYRTNKWCFETHEFRVLWVLQLAPSPRSDGFGLLLSWTQRMNCMLLVCFFTPPVFFSFFFLLLFVIGLVCPPQVSHISYCLIVTQTTDFPRPSKGSRP